MYYIYHIPSIKKIGCTDNLAKRVECEQGFYGEEYNVIYKTNDIVKASSIELKLQKLYNYKTDNLNYLNMKTHISNQTVTFIIKKEQHLLENFKGLELQLPGLGFVILESEELIKWLIKNLKPSFKVEGTYYIYNKALFNAYNVFCFGDLNEDLSRFDKIRDWADKRGIYDKGDSKTQYVKLQEECGELAKALLNNDRPEIIDAIGDITVVLTNLATLEKLNIEDCIDSAYKVISDRTGKMQNGTFIKDV